MRTALVCLMAIVMGNAPGSAPDRQPPGTAMRMKASPFLFTPRPPRRLMFEDDDPRLLKWLDAVDRHEPGAGDDAALAIQKWPEDDLAAVVAMFEGTAFQRPSGDPSGAWASADARARSLDRVTVADRLRERFGDPWLLLERAVVLHTDVAATWMVAANQPDVAWRATTSSRHFGVAMELVEWLRRAKPKDPFVRAWYHATAAFLLSRYDIGSTPDLVDAASLLFPDDADLLVIGGGVHELLASQRVQEGPDLNGFEKYGSSADNLAAAERFYRHALSLNPTFDEARLRLARVLKERGHPDQALAEFAKIEPDAMPRRFQYFHHLFTGEAEEALDHAQAARDAYRQATAVFPGAQGPYLALSRMERRGGHLSSAIGALQGMLQADTDRPAVADPWRRYYTAGEAERAADLLDGLREPFRRQP